MPRVVNACKPSPRSDTPSSYWICESFYEHNDKAMFPQTCCCVFSFLGAAQKESRLLF